MGVWPDCTVAGVPRTGTKLPALCSDLQKATPGGDVVQRAAVGQRRRVDGGERRAGLGRVAVDGDLVLVGGAQQALERGRGDLHLGRVVADCDVAAIVGVVVTPILPWRGGAGRPR